MSDRFCLDCGAKLRGRSDKKFCSDHCRNNYNNMLNRDINSLVRNVHALLRKNRRILSELFESEKRKIHIDALLVLGYNLSFFTHMVETESGDVFKYCYEFGYKEAGDNYIELIRNPDIVES